MTTPLSPRTRGNRAPQGGKPGRKTREFKYRPIGVQFPEELAKRILDPVDEGRYASITERMIALVELGLKHEVLPPAPATTVPMPLTGT